MNDVDPIPIRVQSRDPIVVLLSTWRSIYLEDSVWNIMGKLNKNSFVLNQYTPSPRHVQGDASAEHYKQYLTSARYFLLLPLFFNSESST